MDGFDLAKKACCDLIKADIPEVLAVVRMLEPSLLPVMAEREKRALAEVLSRVVSLTEEDVQELREDPGDLQALIAGILLSVRRVADQPLPLRSERAVARAVRSLLTDGAARVGVGPQFARRGLLEQSARNELLLLISGGPQLHADQVAEVVTAAVRREGPLLASDSPLLARGPGELPRTLAEVQSDLRSALSLSEPSIERAIDSWAYRIYGIGALAAAIATGQGDRLVYVNNPPLGPDETTTAFCEWVDGRSVDFNAALAQLDRHLSLVQAGDVQGLVQNSPFLDSATARRGSPREFRTFLTRNALAPFHHGCRTTIELAT